MMLHPRRGWALAFAGALVAFVGLLIPPSARAADLAFQAWLQSLWPEAEKQGVSRATFEAATRDLQPDLSLPDLIIPGRPETPPPGQAEFVQTPSEYFRESTLAHLAAQGRELYHEHLATLLQIEREFGVPPHILLAIWGRETAFGTAELKHDAIQVLATQGFYGQRKDFFLKQFLLALKMLEEGVNPADMRSSWGGAVGMIQLLPSEYFENAVDFDGDGRRDIWHSVPDALASAAKQLAGKGWQPSKHWAYEVLPPAGVD